MSLIVDGTNGVTFNDSSLQGAAASPYVLKNRIINGDMRIDQRNAGASVTATTSAPYSVDRWQLYSNPTSKFTAQQSSTAPTGFNNSLLITSSSAYTITSGDSCIIQQPIEGYNVSDLGFGTANAQTVTISFWVRSSLTGTFGGSLQNYASNRSYPFSYTISSANTWEQKSITITGDTSGTWVGASNAGSMVLVFGLGVGSTRSGTSGAWASANYYAPTGATSVVGTNGATFYITGVQLEIGTSATPFERRLYGQELINCQRYYVMYAKGEIGLSISNGTYYNASTFIGTLNLPVFMRAYPTIEASTGVGDFILIRNGGTDPLNGVALNCYGYSNIELINDTTASGTAGNGTTLRTNSTTAYLAMKAEL